MHFLGQKRKPIIENSRTRSTRSTKTTHNYLCQILLYMDINYTFIVDKGDINQIVHIHIRW